jgi:hypothetical protein
MEYFLVRNIQQKPWIYHLLNLTCEDDGDSF